MGRFFFLLTGALAHVSHGWSDPKPAPSPDIRSFAVASNDGGKVDVRDRDGRVTCTFEFDTRAKKTVATETPAVEVAAVGSDKMTVAGLEGFMTSLKQCLRTDIGRWSYELCAGPGKKMRQYYGDASEEDFSLGVYQGPADPVGKPGAFLYTGGDRCGSRPRESLIILRCDHTAGAGAPKIQFSTEPSQCVYRVAVGAKEACWAGLDEKNLEHLFGTGAAGGAGGAGGGNAAPEANAPERWVLEISRMEPRGWYCYARNAEQRNSELASRSTFASWSLALQCGGGTPQSECSVTGFKAVDAEGSQAGRAEAGRIVGEGKLEMASVRAAR